MAGFKIIAQANKVLDDNFGSGDPANWIAHLYSVKPNADGTGGTEIPAGRGYAPLVVPNNVANFPAASGGQKVTGQQWSFGPAENQEWPAPVAIVLKRSDDSSMRYVFEAVSTPSPVPIGSPFNIASGSVICREA
jgi:hypothetical protein